MSEVKEINGVLAIIVFGSYARGDTHEGSDIDLLVLFARRKDLLIGRERLAGLRSRKRLFLQIISLTPGEFERSNLLDLIMREGKILYSKVKLMNLLSRRLKPFSVVTYSTSKLSEKDRVLFAQSLDGRGKGRYRYQGLIHQLGGFKIGRGVLMVPSVKLNQITRHFTGNKVDYTVRNVWVVS